MNHSPADKTILQLRTFAERTRGFLSAEKASAFSDGSAVVNALNETKNTESADESVAAV
jgi:hypothetical protein